MARARNIKPGFCTNEDLAECSVEARLCFAMLPMLADREGRLEDRPKRIKGELFRFDSIDVDPLLAELQKHGFILRYEVNGLGLIQILAFAKHQNPHHREPESTLPPPQSLRLDADGKYIKPEALDSSNGAKAPDKPQASPGLDTPKDDLASGSSRVDSGFLIPDPGTPISPTGVVTSEPASLPGFDRFWAAWPKSTRKEAKGKCLDVWRKAKAESVASAIVAHVEYKKTTEDWRKQGGQFIEAPLVYLNGRKWEGAEVDAAGDLLDDMYRGAR